MIILDTDVLSALIRRPPEKTVVDWLDVQPRASIWTTSINLFEVQWGLQVMIESKRRAELAAALQVFMTDVIADRIAPFDSEAAQLAAELVASRRTRGRPVDLRDTMIAGIVLATHSTLATRNVRHFNDLDAVIINPWRS